MLLLELTMRPLSAGRKHLWYGGLSCLFAAGIAISSSEAAANQPVRAQTNAAAQATTSKPDPEVLLINIYKELGANHLRAALEKADRLVTAYPNFCLNFQFRGYGNPTRATVFPDMGSEFRRPLPKAVFTPMSNRAVNPMAIGWRVLNRVT